MSLEKKDWQYDNDVRHEESLLCPPNWAPIWNETISFPSIGKGVKENRKKETNVEVKTPPLPWNLIFPKRNSDCGQTPNCHLSYISYLFETSSTPYQRDLEYLQNKSPISFPEWGNGYEIPMYLKLAKLFHEYFNIFITLPKMAQSHFQKQCSRTYKNFVAWKQ